MATLVSYAIVQLDVLKEALQLTGTTHDERLNGYINRATDIIESYIGFRPYLTTYTNEVYSGVGSRELTLRHWPVTTLTSLSNATGDFSNPNWEAIDSSDYSLKTNANDRGIVYLGGFYQGVNNYRATYTAGYTTIPHDLQEAAIEMVSYLFNRRRVTPGLRSESLGKYSYSLDPIGGLGIIKFLGLNAILDRYRTVPV